jgi:hypothetical protein
MDRRYLALHLSPWSEEQENHYTDMLTAAFVELAAAPMIASACDHVTRIDELKNKKEAYTWYQLVYITLDVNNDFPAQDLVDGVSILKTGKPA